VPQLLEALVVTAQCRGFQLGGGWHKGRTVCSKNASEVISYVERVGRLGVVAGEEMVGVLEELPLDEEGNREGGEESLLARQNRGRDEKKRQQ